MNHPFHFSTVAGQIQNHDCDSSFSKKLTGNRDEMLERILNDPHRQESSSRRILVRDGSDVHVIPVDDVLYMESADDYVAIHTTDATHIKLDRLNRLEERLNPRLKNPVELNVSK